MIGTFSLRKKDIKSLSNSSLLPLPCVLKSYLTSSMLKWIDFIPFFFNYIWQYEWKQQPVQTHQHRFQCMLENLSNPYHRIFSFFCHQSSPGPDCLLQISLRTKYMAVFPSRFPSMAHRPWSMSWANRHYMHSNLYSGT